MCVCVCVCVSAASRTHAQAAFDVTSDRMKAKDYTSYFKLNLACLPFVVLPLLLTPIIPRTREDFHALPQRVRKLSPKLGTMLSALVRCFLWLASCWPSALRQRDFHPASTSLLLWWICGFTYSYYKTFEAMWGSMSSTLLVTIAVLAWGAVFPFLFLSLFTKCFGQCASGKAT